MGMKPIDFSVSIDHPRFKHHYGPAAQIGFPIDDSESEPQSMVEYTNLRVACRAVYQFRSKFNISRKEIYGVRVWRGDSMYDSDFKVAALGATVIEHRGEGCIEEFIKEQKAAFERFRERCPGKCMPKVGAL